MKYKCFSGQDCPKVIHTMMMECWREDRTKRPKFDDLVQLLEQLISSPDLLSDEMADQINCKRYVYKCFVHTLQQTSSDHDGNSEGVSNAEIATPTSLDSNSITHVSINNSIIGEYKRIFQAFRMSESQTSY